MSYKEDMQCIISYWTCGQIIGFSRLNGRLLKLRIDYNKLYKLNTSTPNSQVIDLCNWLYDMGPRQPTYQTSFSHVLLPCPCPSHLS